MGKTLPWSKDVNLKGQVALMVERNQKLFWSSTDTIQRPNDDSGEVCYKATTDVGDCGAPVYQNHMAVGIHVGTDGPNTWNKFVPFALISVEIERRLTA
jgi:V8-like Glu-specific endopeptidase